MEIFLKKIAPQKIIKTINSKSLVINTFKKFQQIIKTHEGKALVKKKQKIIYLNIHAQKLKCNLKMLTRKQNFNKLWK